MQTGRLSSSTKHGSMKAETSTIKQTPLAPSPGEPLGPPPTQSISTSKRIEEPALQPMKPQTSHNQVPCMSHLPSPKDGGLNSSMTLKRSTNPIHTCTSRYSRPRQQKK